jgi:hypothetical protein
MIVIDSYMTIMDWCLHNFQTFDDFVNKQANMGVVNTHASSVVICTCHLSIM